MVHFVRPRGASFVAQALTALGVGVAVGLLAFGGLAALSARQDAWQDAERSSHNLLLALERDIGRNISILDLSLQSVAGALAEPGIDQATAGVRQRALFDGSANAEDLGSVLVMDAGGNVTESSTPLPSRKPNFANRDYFLIHRDHPDAGLYLSSVFHSRLREGKPTIAISRRLSAKDGSFSGVASAALSLDYFRHLFEKMDVGPNGSISLVRTDGRIVWRYPSKDGSIGLDMSRGESFHHLLALQDGHYVGRSSVDDVARLFTFGRIDGLPLILTVNLSIDDIYARWRQKALIIGPVLVLMCAAVILLSLLFRREMLRRAAAEAALHEAARELSFMASTDALTGLANRRSFETAVAREWRRASREQGLISLLMVDADNFKSFNDRYGHQEGDRILRLVAGCIDRNVKRPADLAARYGGEEFVVLLPNCDAAGARIVAENIRVAVEDLDIMNAGSADRKVTVSIGVATTFASLRAGTHLALMKAADEALYEAKGDGRNRVCVFDRVPFFATGSGALTEEGRDGAIVCPVTVPG